MGGAAAFADIVTRHKVLLAAHGPYTAEGVRTVTGGLAVGTVSRRFSTFDGLVTALEEHFAEAAVKAAGRKEANASASMAMAADAAGGTLSAGVATAAASAP
ncbi:hypothetical protein Vretifemale_9060 [Volvox reticuliferus]|nr:hypothetical protein Vretifemale_9060 [Volvox reticuliferus]